MRSITVTEIRDHQNQRQTSRPYVTVRRFDGRYHVMAKIEGLEHMHKTGYKDRSVAWQLVKRVRQHLDNGNDLNLEHWDTEDPDPGGSSVHEEHPSEGRGVTPCEALPEVTVPIRTGLVTLTGYLGGDPEYRETEEREISGTRTRREQFVVQNGSHFIRRLVDTAFPGDDEAVCGEPLVGFDNHYITNLQVFNGDLMGACAAAYQSSLGGEFPERLDRVLRPTHRVPFECMAEAEEKKEKRTFRPFTECSRPTCRGEHKKIDVQSPAPNARYRLAKGEVPTKKV